VPLGSEVLSADEPQSIASVRVYPGSDGSFALFQDDGKTYAYEKGAGAVTKLSWNDAAKRLTHEGPAAWSGADGGVVKVVGK
jgi:alpha-glucosidase (family GH31 glycosyl hydrolase)